MRQLYITFTVGAAALFVVAFAGAAEFATQGNATQPGVGQAISVDLPQPLMVQAHCDEFKSLAGLAISYVDAAHEAFDGKLSEFDVLGANFRLKSYVDDSSGLRSQMDGVCSAATFDEARALVPAYRETADSIRGQFRGLDARMKADIEKWVAEHEADIRANMEEELRAEVADLENEARARLEAQLRAEAEQRKNTMRDRIQKEVEAELMAEYGGQENPDVDFLMKLGEERGRARGESEAVAVEAELRAKYERLAEDEVEIIKAAAEEKAKEKEAKLRTLYQGFGRISDEINVLTNQKRIDEWDSYKEKALASRKVVTEYMVKAYYNQARTIIGNNNQLVEMAPDWVRTTYGLKSTAELLAQLNADEELTLKELANVSEADAGKIAAWEEKYSKRWHELRDRMNKLMVSAPEILFDRLDRALERRDDGYSGVENYLRQAKKNASDNVDVQSKSKAACASNPELIEGGPSVSKVDCAMCRLSVKGEALSAYSSRVSKKIDDCSALIGELDTIRPNVLSGAMSLSDGVNKAVALESCLNGLREMHDPYVDLVKDFDARFNSEQWRCENN